MALTNRSVAIDRSPMTFVESLYLPSIFKGMGITFSHIFKKKPTINYPEQTRPFSPVFRGLHVLNRDEEGRENCTACGLCAVACPAEAITMEAAERLPGEENLYREEKYAAKYEINMLRCIFCGLCEEACPKDAIYLSETFAPANFARKGFIYGKDDLLIPNKNTEPEAYAKAKGLNQ
ncbi:MAG: NADH-quinone oxidoreductase subunit NuoI [Bacteroidetes bacterium]|jgi:NADH-quinone oxidoreductase subunit I|nr:MAG: NADH-quinone oxidoreductase subunit NuoI [Bacteroidota bacterium]TAE67659.1 MAG: NADH-quinone oxidoreductase subunit NuoI [Bacteroidota bacterium]TAF92953.1 MAG: NADH-quinone oxidoreductase subunit NuoI [Bacteroidota bacterium]